MDTIDKKKNSVSHFSTEQKGSLKMKVCGMRDAENINGLVKIAPDFMGMIFYDQSPRYVRHIAAEVIESIPPSIKKTGVFVNADFSEIMKAVLSYQLQAVQLHGDEEVSLVKRLRNEGLIVIKVFRIMDQLPDLLDDFEGEVDYFLFDTRAKAYGGTGHHFDWSALKKYKHQTPYFLSGGLRIEDIQEIKSLKLPRLVGLDVNSKFETAPGMKDLNMVRELKKKL